MTSTRQLEAPETGPPAGGCGGGGGNGVSGGSGAEVGTE